MDNDLLTADRQTMNTIQLDQHLASNSTSISRRRFLGASMALGATVSAFGLLRGEAADATVAVPRATEFARKIKLGVVGNGGRGAWIANLFKRHGGYEMWAVADYFQEVADVCGDALGVDKSIISTRRAPCGISPPFTRTRSRAASRIPPCVAR